MHYVPKGVVTNVMTLSLKHRTHSNYQASYGKAGQCGTKHAGILLNLTVNAKQPLYQKGAASLSCIYGNSKQMPKPQCEDFIELKQALPQTINK
jgi:hypothetical protein